MGNKSAAAAAAASLFCSAHHKFDVCLLCVLFHIAGNKVWVTSVNYIVLYYWLGNGVITVLGYLNRL